MVHRDIKPENLLIDKNFRLVIADFNFATRLKPAHCYNASSLLTALPDSQVFDPYVKRDISVGSVAYNAPELWEIEQQLEELKQNGNLLDLSNADCLNYDGVKADIFSAAATLFLLKMKFQPFRRAHPMDPYYKKLAFKGKKYFWKIYSRVATSNSFKDIFEKMSGHNPEERLDSSQVMEHEFAVNSPEFTEEIEQEI